MQQMKINLNLGNCLVVQSRVEDHAGTFDQITCRAFASLADIIKKTAHLLSHDGEILALKGRLEDSEINGDFAPFEIAAIHELVVPWIDAERHLVVLKKVSQE